MTKTNVKDAPFSKENLKSLLLGVSLFLGIGLAVRYLSLGWAGLWALNLLLSFGMLYLTGTYTHARFLKNAVFGTIYLGVSFLIVEYTLFGWWGPTILTVFGLAFFFYVRWPAYIKAKQDCERAIWGKSIKEFKDSGEKLPKIRIKW